MTLKDIAKETGVSVSTVSRVLNGNDPKSASKAVRDKIWEAARMGGYVPNKTAQNLKQGSLPLKSGKSIACIYARTSNVRNDAFFSTLTRTIEQEALKNGYVVKYSLSVADINTPLSLKQIQNNDADGAIILGRCSKTTLKFLKEHFHKVIYTGLNVMDTDCDQVICDGYSAASDAVRHLLKSGYSSIGYIGETKNEVRYNAYRDVLRQSQISFDQNLVANAYGTLEDGYQAAKRMLSRTQNLSSIFCMNDITAIGTIKGIQECGLKVPEDIAVISIDDIDLAQFVSPTLTTIHIPIDEMGIIATKSLIDRIQNGHTLPLKISLPYHLVQRESCLIQ